MPQSPTEFKLVLPLMTGGTRRKLKDGTLKPPTKRYWLNLNNYRNWHYQTLNNTKRQFKDLVKAQILALPDISALFGEVRLDYVFYPKTRRLADCANIVSVVDKYFCDALVELNKLSDDNFTILKGSSWEFGEVDKDNPRMEVFIRPHSDWLLQNKPPPAQEQTAMEIKQYTPRKVTPQNEATLPSTHDATKRISYMQVILQEAELAEAVQNYIRQQMPIVPGDEMPVVFIAGRGDNGHSAQVTLLAAKIEVQSPDRPLDTVEPQFEAARAAAQASNASEQPEQAEEPDLDPEVEETVEEEAPEAPETPAESETAEAPQDDDESPFVEDDAPVAEETAEEPVQELVDEPTEETEPLADVQDERDEPKTEEPVKAPVKTASALFGGTAKPKPTPAEAQEDAPAQTETKEEPMAIQPTAPQKKSGSIFDNL